MEINMDNSKQLTSVMKELTKLGRKAYQKLCQGPVFADRNIELYEAILNQENEIDFRLKDDGAKLVVNKETRFAYVTERESEDGEVQSHILRTLKLNKYDSFLWFYLRQVQLTADINSVNAHLSEGDLIDQLNLIEPQNNQHQKKHIDSINSSIKKAIDNNVIKELKTNKGEEKRYIVTPYISIILSTNTIQRFRNEFIEGQSNQTQLDTEGEK